MSAWRFSFSDIPHTGNMFPHCMVLPLWRYVLDITVIQSHTTGHVFSLGCSEVGSITPLAVADTLHILQIITSLLSDFLKPSHVQVWMQHPFYPTILHKLILPLLQCLFFTQLSLYRNVCLL